MSEWAAICPACGASLDDAVSATTDGGARPAGAEGPPPAARRASRRSRRAVIGAVVAVVALGTYVGVRVAGGHHRPSPSAVAGYSLGGYTLLDTGQDGPRLVPADGSSPSALMPPDQGVAERPIQVSGGLVFLHRGVAYFLSASGRPSPLTLGPADRLFAMVWPGVVGLQRGLGAGPVSVQFVSTTGDGGGNSPVWQLPAGYRPLAQAGSGLLVINDTGELRTWALAGGVLGPVFGHAATVIDTHSDQVAWRDLAGCEHGECPLHITDANTGVDRLVPPPPTHHGFMDGGGFSPDGARLALFVSAPTAGSPRADLVLVDPRTSIINRIANGDVAVGEPVGMAAWTPDSTTLFFCGLTGEMRAYRPGDKAALTLNIPGSYSFAAL